MARDEDTPLPKLPPSAPVLNDVESAPGSRAATPPVPASPVSPTREKEKGKDRRAGKKGGGLTEGDEGELASLGTADARCGGAAEEQPRHCHAIVRLLTMPWHGADPSLCLVLFLAALDQTIIATALPTIAGQFNATPSQYSWIVTVSRGSGAEGKRGLLYPPTPTRPACRSASRPLRRAKANGSPTSWP